MKTIEKHGLVRATPDAFLADLYDQASDLVVGSLANARRNLAKSNVSAQDFLALLKGQGLTKLEKPSSDTNPICEWPSRRTSIRL